MISILFWFFITAILAYMFTMNSEAEDRVKHEEQLKQIEEDKKYE